MILLVPAPFKRSGFSFALGKMSKRVTYTPAALEHLAARMVVTLLG
jgi:hypothetical protein